MPDSIEDAQILIWQVVNAIPRGKVATYGQIARLAGLPQQARLVGRILSRLPAGSRLPWHRVINSQGKVTNPSPERQFARLADEGIVPIQGRINLKLYGWQP